MNNRNTKQKEIILSVIRNNRIHPTIQEIFELSKKIDPTIGQATVYRNVKRFVEEGQIFVVKTKTGLDRYDYYNEHIHFECLECGKIKDIIDDDILLSIKKSLKNREEMILRYNVLVEGYCEECRRNIDEEV